MMNAAVAAIFARGSVVNSDATIAVAASGTIGPLGMTKGAPLALASRRRPLGDCADPHPDAGPYADPA